jgi:hypothetical protein
MTSPSGSPSTPRTPRGPFCCLSLDLVERELAAHFGLTCSPGRCCRDELALIGEVQAGLAQLDERDDGQAA